MTNSPKYSVTLLDMRDTLANFLHLTCYVSTQDVGVLL